MHLNDFITDIFRYGGFVRYETAFTTENISGWRGEKFQQSFFEFEHQGIISDKFSVFHHNYLKLLKLVERN